jgi:ATP-dependent Zn protease
MVGADLAYVVNEAALASVRRGGAEVAARDFEEAVDRIQLGLKRDAACSRIAGAGPCPTCEAAP